MEIEDRKERERKEREEYVAKYGQNIVRQLNEMLGPKLKNYKDQFISSVNHVFDKWEAGHYRDETHVLISIEKRFYRKLPFEEAFDVWASSEEGKVGMEVLSEEFPSRVAEKLGRQRFAQKIEAKTSTPKS